MDPLPKFKIGDSVTFVAYIRPDRIKQQTQPLKIIRKILHKHRVKGAYVKEWHYFISRGNTSKGWLFSPESKLELINKPKE